MKLGSLIFFILFSCLVFGQRTLEITHSGIGGTKVFKIAENSALVYKNKIFSFYKKAAIARFNDSLVMLQTGQIFYWHQIRKLRVDRDRLGIKILQRLCVFAGVGFFALNTTNQMITNNEPVFSEKAAIFSASALAAGLILREFTFRRLKLNKKTVIRVVEFDYEHLKEKAQ